METSVLKNLGQIAGIGGISLGVLLILLRGIIRKNIFPKFKNEKLAYRLLRLIVIVVWSVAIVGIAAWVLTTLFGNKPAGTISVSNTEYSGDIQFVDARVISNQYLQIYKKPPDESLKKDFEQGVNLINGGLFKEALPIFEKIAGEVELPTVYNNLGGLYAVTKNPDNARDAFVKSIKLDPDDQRVHFNLGLLEKADLEQIESEPNNDILSPDLIPLGKWVQSAIQSNQDNDFFQITTPGKYRDLVKIELQNTNTLLRPQIRIYDGSKKSLYDTWASNSGENIGYSFAAPPGSVYYIQVFSVESRTHGPFQLKITPSKAYDHYEPNDEILKASPISIGKSVEANIMDNLDEDYYRTKTSSGKNTIAVSLENRSATFIPYIEIFDGNKKSLISLAGSTPGQNLECSDLSRTDSAYYIRIAGSNHNSNGAYRLTVREISGEG